MSQENSYYAMSAAVAVDDVLTLQTFLAGRDRTKEYQDENFLIQQALRQRSYYCARYMLSLRLCNHYSDRTHAGFLWAGLDSRESMMLELAASRVDAFDHRGARGFSLPTQAIMDADTGMAEEIFRQGGELPVDIPHVVMYHTKYARNATMRWFMPSPIDDREELCQEVLRDLRRRQSDDVIAQTAVVDNDWMLLQHILEHNPSVIHEALICDQGVAAIPWFWHRAAANNSAKSLGVLCEFLNLDAVDRYGHSILYLATMFGNISTVRILMAMGASPSGTTNLDTSLCSDAYLLKRANAKCLGLIAEALLAEHREALPQESGFRSASLTVQRLILHPRQFESEALHTFS